MGEKSYIFYKYLVYIVQTRTYSYLLCISYMISYAYCYTRYTLYISYTYYDIAIPLHPIDSLPEAGHGAHLPSPAAFR